VANAESVIHIHEDDWGMRNLYPLVTQAEVSADMDAAIAAGRKNRDPSGFGWSDVHVIKPPSTSYIEAGLLLSDGAAALAPIMPRVRHFYASILSMIGRGERDPLGSYDDDAWCFGFSRQCYVKLDVKGEYVERIWFDLRSDAPEHAIALRGAMEAIDRLVPSLVADYFMEAAAPVADAELLDRYFAHLKG
jgi:hypothetical protein